MKTITVNLKERSYNILVGKGIAQNIGAIIRRLKLGNSAYIITNAGIKRRYGTSLRKSLLKARLEVKFKLIPDTEESKSLKTAYSVIEDLTSFDRNKHIFIVALGGGVVGDLAGFVASVYKRGIAYVQVPTTLLAQVDSAIGGKTAVDLKEAKNLVGAFYQPRLVASDVRMLASLPLKQIRAGLAEVIKYGIISDAALFTYIEKKYKKILSADLAAMEFIVSRCSNIKARIVERDEKEARGIRTVLNFGHTLGHAIEAAGGYKGYNHGEAVALGMLLSCDISERMRLSDTGAAKRIEDLIRKAGLPVKISKVSFKRIIKAHYRDKKFIGARNRFVLLKGIGRTKIVEDVPLAVIKETLAARM